MSSPDQADEARFVPGEVVDLHLSDSIVIGCPTAETVTVQTADAEVTVRIDGTDVRIIRQRPADGIPGPGELWRDAAGGLWFAQEERGEIRLAGANVGKQHPGMLYRSWLDVHRSTGPLRRVWSEAVDTGE